MSYSDVGLQIAYSSRIMYRDYLIIQMPHTKADATHLPRSNTCPPQIPVECTLQSSCGQYVGREIFEWIKKLSIGSIVS